MKVWCEMGVCTCTIMVSQAIYLKTIFINEADNFQKDYLANAFTFRSKTHFRPKSPRSKFLHHTQSDPPPTHPQTHTHVHKHTHTHAHMVEILWTSDRLVVEAATYTTHNKHEVETPSPSAEFEPTITSFKRLQTSALNV